MNIDVKSQIKQTLDSPDLSVEFKTRIEGLLPLLEKQTMFGLNRELNDRDFFLIQDVVADLWGRFGKIIDGLKRRNTGAKDNFWSIFKETQDVLNKERKVQVLNLVIDVRRLATENDSELFSESELWDLVEYEISLLRYLPAEEIAALLDGYLIEVLKRINLQKEMEISAYDFGWIADQSALRSIADILLRSRARVGSKSVSTWLQEFIKFDGIVPTKKTMLHVAEFVVKEHDVRSFGQEEKLLLSELLNIFLWCLKPLVDETALGNYKREVEEQRKAYFDKLYKLSLSGQEPLALKYFWPDKDVSLSVSTVKSGAQTFSPVFRTVPTGTLSMPRPMQPTSPLSRVQSGASVPPVPRPPAVRQNREFGIENRGGGNKQTSPTGVPVHPLPSTGEGYKDRTLPPPPRPPEKKRELRIENRDEDQNSSGLNKVAIARPPGLPPDFESTKSFRAGRPSEVGQATEIRKQPMTQYSNSNPAPTPTSPNLSLERRGMNAGTPPPLVPPPKIEITTPSVEIKATGPEPEENRELRIPARPAMPTGRQAGGENQAGITSPLPSPHEEREQYRTPPASSLVTEGEGQEEEIRIDRPKAGVVAGRPIPGQETKIENRDERIEKRGGINSSTSPNLSLERRVINAGTPPSQSPPARGEGDKYTAFPPRTRISYREPDEGDVSINDALARAGEDGGGKLTGGLPPKGR